MVYGYCVNCFTEHGVNANNYPPMAQCGYCGMPNGVIYSP